MKHCHSLSGQSCSPMAAPKYSNELTSPGQYTILVIDGESADVYESIERSSMSVDDDDD